jgi:hypothetical protein
MLRHTLTLLLIAIAAPTWGLDGNAILQQVDRNLAPESYEMYRKLINQEPDGTRKEFVLYTAKKGRDSMMALFLSPASELGRTTLRLGDNMWLYIPNVGKPLRITSLQSVVGGIFNNSDLMRLEFSTEYEVQGIEEQDAQYVLDLKARTGAVAYDRLKMQVDRELLLPTVIEAYAASGLLVKTLRYRKIKDYGNGVVRPSILETDSPLYRGYKAVMLFAKILPREFPDEVFSLNYMPRVQELR